MTETRDEIVTAETVTMLATVVLTLATIAYVVLTGRLAGSASEANKQAAASAASSERSAEAALATARTLADATAKATAISEASLNVDFRYRAVHAQGDRTIVVLECVSASVFVSKVEIRLYLIAEPADEQDGFVGEIEGTTTFSNGAIRINQGDTFFAVVDAKTGIGATVFGQALVDFGFTEEGHDRQRTVQIRSHRVNHVLDALHD